MEGNKVVYCHFSFRRPRGEGYGIFSCALYKDYDGTEPVIKRVCMEDLWKDHQHITAIQAYRFALDSIYKWQSHLLNAGVVAVLLVTDNQNLAGWILNPKKGSFKEYMRKAYRPYQIGTKRLTITVGLCIPRDYEKSHKFCKIEFVENYDEFMQKGKQTKLALGGMRLMSDVIAEDMPKGVLEFKPISSEEALKGKDEEEQ